MEEEKIPPQERRVTKELVRKFRATPDEVNRIDAKAAAAGVTFSEYVRRAALDKPLTQAVPSELRLAILAVGNNLNQLARLANAGRLPGVGAEEMQDVVQRLYELLRR